MLFSPPADTAHPTITAMKQQQRTATTAMQLTPERIFDIMSEEKANQKERVRLEVSAIRKYFPRSYTPAQMEQSILKMLDEQYRNRRRSREER